MRRVHVADDGSWVDDTSAESVILSTLWDHRDAVRAPNPAGRKPDGALIEPAFVWRCTGTRATGEGQRPCEWLHEQAHDGLGAHFTHQASEITTALVASGMLDADTAFPPRSP